MTASIKRIGGGGGGGAGAAGGAAAMADYYEGEVRRDLTGRTALARGASKTADEYRMADPAAPLARWWSAAGRLAPDGAPILPGQLRNALDGTGLDGAKLVQGAARNARVGGWDVTFSAPKDVSVLYAAADPATRRALLEDVAASAKAGLRALHGQGVFETRRGKGGAVRQVAADVAAAVFPQATSRAGDPQLHAHAVVVNAALRADGTTGALDPQKLYPWKTFAGAVFRAELAHRLERRGLAVEPDEGQAFRIAGAPRALAEAWSARRGQVLAGASGADGMDGEAKRKARERAARRTRSAKDAVPADADLDARWAADMVRHGLAPEGVWRSAREAAERHRRPERSAGEAGLEEALERRSVATERELRRLVAEAAQTRGGGGAAGAEAEADRLLAAGGPLLELGRTRDGERVFSTRVVLERERRMLLDATERRAEAGPFRAEAVEAALAARPTLAEEQIAAVRHAAGRGGVAAVEGLAGAGKSFALGALADAARGSGARVAALAPSWQAAEVVGGDTGAPARALQGFVRELERGEARLGRGDVVVLDEAGMAGSRDVASLLAHARGAGAKVVLSGDRGQLRSVEPGAAFAAIADAIGVSRLAEVRRQELHGWQREASAAFGAGDAVEGLARYDAKGRVVYAADTGAAIRRAADAWEANRKAHPGASRLVLAARNAEVHALNAELRARALAAGDLGAEAITLRTLHAGGRRGARGEAREMEVRTGDRVAVGARLDAKGVLPNDTATVLGFARGADPALRLRLDRTGGEVALRASELAPPAARKGREAAERPLPALQHAYAQTVHKSQARTVDYAIVFGGAGLDARRAYVALTRHRRDAVVVADAGAVGERLAAGGIGATADEVRQGFLRAARSPDDKANAADFVADRAAWLRTGDPRALSDAPRLSRLRYAMERAAETAARARRAVAERLRAMGHGRETARTEVEHAAARDRGGRGHTLGR